jgi:hypothetical protein
LANGIDLRRETSSRNANANVYVCKSITAKEKDRFKNLDSQEDRLRNMKRAAIQPDVTLSCLAKSLFIR